MKRIFKKYAWESFFEISKWTKKMSKIDFPKYFMKKCVL
jgi:hypothetical protein